MANLPSIGALSLIGVLLAGPVLAQQTPDKAPPATDQQTVTPPATHEPAAPSTSAAAEQPPITGTLSTGDPHLVVATVTMKNGWRASKLIGSAVYNDQNQKIGSVDDLILTRDDDKVAMAVISVGGFLGMGSKLVAVPYDQLRFEITKDNEQRVHLPGGSKDALNAMPTFTYSNT